MGWLWVLQIVVDAVLITVVWRMVMGRRVLGETRDRSAESDLRREDFERYHEAMSDLCDRLRRESEQWLTQLEQKTRAARQVIQSIEPSAPRPQERPVGLAAARAEERTTVVQTVERSEAREHVLTLHRQGHSVEQIARHLHLGQREVQMLLSFPGRSQER